MVSNGLPRKAFAWSAALSVLLYVVAAAAVPYLLIAAFASCAKNSGGCFMGSILTGMFAWHAIYLLFVLVCTVLILMRLRKLQLPVSLAAIPLIFFLADLQTAAGFGNKLTGFLVSGGAVSSSLFGMPPRYFLFGLLCMLFLGLVTDRDRTGQSQLDRWGIFGFMMFGMLVLLAVGATLETLRTISMALPGLAPYQAITGFQRYYFLYGNLVIILIFIVLTTRWQTRWSS